MPTFTYTARDRDGNQTRGVISAKTQAEVREILRDKDLFLTRATQKGALQEGRTAFGLRRGVKLGDMVVMSRQFATLVRAGLSIVDCLHVLAMQTENPQLVQVLKDVRLDILTGSTLADAMRKHPKAFRESYVALAQAGEAGGVLEYTLDVAAEQFDKEAELREKVKSAFVYPVLVLVASVLVVTFMLLYVVPVFARVYSQFKADLPAITRFLIALSNVVVHWWWIVLLCVIGIVLALRRYIRTDRGRHQYDRFKMNMPLLGKLNRKIAVARFTQTFAGATKAGVPLLKALAISANTSGNIIIIDAVARVTQFIKEGSSISVPLQDTGEFPLMVTRMIAAGEQSGNLDEMLEEITRFYNRDIEYTVQKLTRLMEPAMTVMVGGIVLFVLVALYMPIFNLTNVVRKK